MARLEDRLKVVREEERRILEEIDQRNQRGGLQCYGCHHTHEIGKLVAIQSHGYLCASGDRDDAWVEGELQFVCPKTGVVNRLLFNNDDVPWEERRDFKNDPDQQFKRGYKRLFREVKETYGPTGGDWVNNFYVDRNRKRFGLVQRRKEKDATS